MALYNINPAPITSLDLRDAVNVSKHGPLPHNASKIYYLVKVPLDDEILEPASILVMLLTFIVMVLVMLLFCLLTNPVTELQDNSKKKSLAKGPKLVKKDHLQIDWSRLKISTEKLENLSKIEMCKSSEQATLPAPKPNPKNSSAAKSAAK